jgi:hypothetical protein
MAMAEKRWRMRRAAAARKSLSTARGDSPVTGIAQL